MSRSVCLFALIVLELCTAAHGQTPERLRPATPPARDGRATAPAAAAAGPALARERLMARASSELAAGRPREAERLWTEAVDRFGSVDALLQLAKLQAGRRDYPAALGSLQKARALAPNSEEVLSGFAQVSLAARAITPAVLALQALTRICPTVAQYHYLLGVGLMQAGDFVAGVDALQQSDRLEPNKGLTLIALGLGYNSRKLYADAKPYLLRGLELEPDSVDALAALAESEDGLGELDAAETHARRALDRNAGHANAHLVMGLLLMKRGRLEDARDALLRTLGAEPLLARAHYQLSLAYTRLGDASAAEKHLELYRTSLRDMEERLNRIRLETGLPAPEGNSR